MKIDILKLLGHPARNLVPLVHPKFQPFSNREAYHDHTEGNHRMGYP